MDVQLWMYGWICNVILDRIFWNKTIKTIDMELWESWINLYLLWIHQFSYKADMIVGKCYVCLLVGLYSIVIPHCKQWIVNIVRAYTLVELRQKKLACRPRRSRGRLWRVLKLHFPSINFQRGWSAFAKIQSLRKEDIILKFNDVKPTENMIPIKVFEL